MPPPGVGEAVRSNLSTAPAFQLAGKTGNVSARVHLSPEQAGCIVL